MPRVAKATEAGVVGVSGGTTFVGLVGLMGDGFVKSAAMLLAPAVTLVVGFVWMHFVGELEDFLADRKITKERRRAEAMWLSLKDDPSCSTSMKEHAQKNYEALRLLELQLSRKRAEAVFSSQGELAALLRRKA